MSQLADKVKARLDDETQSAWVKLLNDPAGRLVIWSLLDMTHVFQSSLSLDLAQMAALEGERNIGLRILNERILPANPKALGDLMAENATREQEIERAIEKDEAEKEIGL